MILERLEVGSFASNCYLVACPETKQAIIIDPGAEGKFIIKRVNELGLNVKYIINTHAHIDHIGANGDVKEAFNVPILVHEAEAPMYRSPQSSLALFMGKNKMAPPDQTLKEGDLLELGSLTIKVLDTPGHTAGGICLDINGVLFSGDTLFNSSIGRTDLPGGSYRQILESIREKILIYPDNTKVFPGHGPPTTVGDERRYNPFLT
ncbi:MAG: MBL fold metallo-hydrolase [Bacillota bacterium]|nr:MBL fold metallo-hydrolase [Bacillota bacterium]